MKKSKFILGLLILIISFGFKKEGKQNQETPSTTVQIMIHYKAKQTKLEKKAIRVLFQAQIGAIDITTADSELEIWTVNYISKQDFNSIYFQITGSEPPTTTGGEDIDNEDIGEINRTANQYYSCTYLGPLL